MRTLARKVRLLRSDIAASMAFALALTGGIVVASPPLENVVRDLMTALISPFTHPRSDIVIVVINEQTLAAFPYRSPVDRSFLAGLVARIASYRPRAIGIDLLFDQPTEARKDAELQRAIEAASVPVVLASATEVDGLTSGQIQYLEAFASSAVRGLAILSHDNRDGVVRGAFLGRHTELGWQPSFSAALAVSTGLDSGKGPEEMVYYRTEGGSLFKFPTYPAHSVALAPAKWFEAKYVLIGVDLPGVDRHLTPFALLHGSENGALPGIAIHAHLLAGVISGERVTLLRAAAYCPLLFAVGLFCLWIAWGPTSVLVKPFFVGGAVMALWIVQAFAFVKFTVLSPMVAPAMIIVGLSSYAGVMAWKRDSKASQLIHGAFSKYLNPAVVSSIAQNPDELRLGGERRMITSIFTDIADFTSFSEKVTPEVLANVLNEYMGELCELFIQHGATIDKIIGDSVVGFFGAPADQPDASERALSLALAVQSRTEAMTLNWAERALAFGATRIGIHRGPAIVGNFGGERFLNYTAIGDTVNTAARLESANKLLGTRNCVSVEVASQATGFLFRPIGKLFLHGKENPIETFEVMSRTEFNQRLVREYTKAYALLVAQDELAMSIFAALVESYPEDRLTAFYHARLATGCRGVHLRLEGK